MAWVETTSLSFTARHEAGQADDAVAVLEALEAHRGRARGAVPAAPRQRHGRPPRLAAAARAGAALPSARAAARLAGGAPVHGRLVRGRRGPRARARVPARASRRAGLARGAAAHAAAGLHDARRGHQQSGCCRRRSGPRTRAACCARRGWPRERPSTSPDRCRSCAPRSPSGLRAGPGPPSRRAPRDAGILAGALFDLLARERGPQACVRLARQTLGARLQSGARSRLRAAARRRSAQRFRAHLERLGAPRVRRSRYA